MRYQPLHAALHSENRQKLASLLKPSSLAILHSNDVLPTNADGTLPFVQNTDLYYLTGIDQEETVLILCPDATPGSLKTILFIRETSELIQIWEGPKLSKQQARDISGIDTIYWTSEFERIIKMLAYDVENIYLNANEHKRASNPVQTRDERFMQWCKEQFPLHAYSRIAPIISELRTIKSPAEITILSRACAITHQGFVRAARFLKPGIYEYELQAEFAHEFLQRGSKGFAYEPIIASGSSSCILHYIKNDALCNSGDIVLLDVAAEYGGYKSDLTRVLPVNGRFSVRQRQVYEAVLRILRYAIDAMQVGVLFEDYSKSVAQKVEKELVSLGLISLEEIKNQEADKPAYKKYFMHGVSHFLGLDVHDVGSMKGKMKAGMVLTCEPGIYIKEEAIGIRLENNILLTESGPVDLMKNIPIEVDEIESLMQ